MPEPDDDPCPKAKQLTSSFDEIWAAELSSLEERRRQLFLNTPESAKNGKVVDRAHSLNLFGVGLSGGGIRSATLNLGILQGLSQKGLLPYVDYLSTISGGGYIGTWLHSVICRKTNNRNPREVDTVLNRRVPGQPEDDPVAFLRKYSNYLAPKLGLFSADFWVIFAIWIRNMLLNLLILIPFLASLITSAVIFAPWAARGLKNSPGANDYVGIGVLALLAVAVISSSLNLNAISQRPSQNLHLPLPPVSVTLISVMLTCVTLFFCHWADPFAKTTLGIAARYFAGLWVLLLAMQSFGGFIYCFNSTHKKRYLLLALHLLWMPALAASVGAALFCGAFILIGTAGNAIGPVIWGPPLIAVAVMATVSLHIGLMGVDFWDASREWLARIGAIMAQVSAAWTVFFSLALYGPYEMAKLGVNYGGLALALIVLWLGSTMFGVSAGTSSSTGGKPDEPKQGGWKESLTKLAPTVFVIGLIILISGAVHYGLGAWPAKRDSKPVATASAKPLPAPPAAEPPRDFLKVKVLSTTDSLASSFDKLFAGLRPFVENYESVLESTETAKNAAILMLLFLGMALFLPLRININEFSIHHFYKNRLVRCYLGAGNAKLRKPNRFTGFDSNDDIKIKKLHSGAKEPYLGPYPIVGTTLNLNAGSELAQQERKGASFIFSPLFCGFHPVHSADDYKEVAKPGSRLECDAYIATDDYFTSCGPDIGTAMAISGAAANPSWGYHTSPSVAFLLTFFNVRLGWWIGNPRIKPLSAALEAFTPARRQGPMYGFSWLIWELLGKTKGTVSTSTYRTAVTSITWDYTN